MLLSSARLAAVVLLGSCLTNAQNAPALSTTVSDIMRMQRGYFRGVMVRFEGNATTGDLVARDAAGDLYTCGYDAKTYMEMAHAKIPVTRLAPGDPLQILADQKPGTRACYARLVEVVAPKSRPRTEEKKAPVKLREALPRGDRTLSGVVARIEGDQMTLRTRTGAVQLVMRRDTRYFNDAQLVTPEALGVNTRVSVRAGPALDGTLHVYQVNWGSIISPQ